MPYVATVFSAAVPSLLALLGPAFWHGALPMLARATLKRPFRSAKRAKALLPALVLLMGPAAALPAQKGGQTTVTQWKTVPFAIVRYNDEAPKSWNVYHSDKKGVYLVRLWKRYLIIDTTLQSAFEIDPDKIKVEGDNAELSTSDIPADPVETTQWKSRDAGPVLRHRFRFGQDGNFVELQIPLLVNGKPAY
jgi:hypothetical protein